MKYYDYARGLKAPYSIQVISSPKGKALWVFAQPLNMSYLLMLFFFLFVTGVFWYKVRIPNIAGINLNLLLMLSVPHKVARWYSEAELDGKSTNLFLKDFIVYLKNFVVDQRPIIAFERVDQLEEFSFKR
ncbi:MAG: conjugal transfer protein [Enterococcus faecium]|uniref:TcpE family conjugal transfer membrane protein n=1 Tax=Enterococcus faecium TaxID=1352 RepID=UPI000CF0AA45|nr:TcpE family conjugal transfer membrane protein [Enterococcus faecium]EGP5630260.1 conjugal transfer protein [Enterococcus faecium]MBS6010465.1 conjugal transfer protein [Enterococcus faecium]PQC82854.1 conjugal transfer protein [Enterococcus faecium]